MGSSQRAGCHTSYVTASVRGCGGPRPPPCASVGLAGAAVAPKHAGRTAVPAGLQTGTSTWVGPSAPGAGVGVQALGSTGGGVSADCRAGHAAIWDGQGRGAWRLAPRSRSACHALTRVCCAPAVPADQTPAADARLSPLERCAGLGRGAAVRTLRFRSGDGCRGAPLSRRRLLGEALSPLPPPRRRDFASYCKSK